MLNVRSVVTGAAASMSSRCAAGRPIHGDGKLQRQRSLCWKPIAAHEPDRIKARDGGNAGESSTNPALESTPVTLTVRVLETDANVEVETAEAGTVQVTDMTGAVNLEAPLYDEQTTLVIPYFAAGRYTLAAHFSGSVHLAAGESAPLVLQVVKAPLPSTTLPAHCRQCGGGCGPPQRP